MDELAQQLKVNSVKKKKLIIIIAVIVMLAAIGTAIAVTISRNNNTADGEASQEVIDGAGTKYAEKEENVSLISSEQVGDNTFYVAVIDEDTKQIYHQFVDKDGNKIADTSYADGYTEKANEYINGILGDKYKNYKCFVELTVRPNEDTKLTSDTPANEFLSNSDVKAKVDIAFATDSRKTDYDYGAEISELLRSTNSVISVYFVNDTEFIQDATYLWAYIPSYEFMTGNLLTLENTNTTEGEPTAQ